MNLDAKLTELWGKHLTNAEYFYLVDAVRTKQELTISEVTNATISSSGKRNNSDFGGGIFATTE